MIRAAAIGVAGLVAAGAVSPVLAHKFPPRHSVTVQAEPDGVAILVVWTSANDETAQRLIARAAVQRDRRRANAFLESLAANRALAPLSFELDGSPMPIHRVDTKVTLDPNRPDRIAAVVLVTAKIPTGTHSLRVTTDRQRRDVRVAWVDRSDGRASSGSTRAGTWTSHTEPLSIAWSALDTPSKD